METESMHPDFKIFKRAQIQRVPKPPGPSGAPSKSKDKRQAGSRSAAAARRTIFSYISSFPPHCVIECKRSFPLCRPLLLRPPFACQLGTRHTPLQLQLIRCDRKGNPFVASCLLMIVIGKQDILEEPNWERAI